MKSVYIDMEYLVFAYQDESSENIYYLDTEYGDIRLVNQDLLDLKDLTDELEIMQDKFLYVPRQNKEELLQDLLAFIDSVAESSLKQVLQVGMESPHLVNAFKTILSKHPDELSRFAAYLKAQSEARLLVWLKANAIEPQTKN